MVKKGFAVLLGMVFALAMMAAPVFAADTGTNYVKIVELMIGEKEAAINGEVATMDQAAYVKAGRTLVPFRFLAEALGAQVSWDAATKTASLVLKDSDVKVTLGSKDAYIKGVKTSLDVAAESKGGRTFIPLRFVSEALGAEVDYDAESKTVTVTLIDTTGWKEYNYTLTGETLIYPPDWTFSGSGNKIEVTSPRGTKILLDVTQEETSKLLADKKDAYIKNGYELVNEGPVDEKDPGAGSALVLIKADLADMTNSDMYTFVVAEADNTKIFCEITGKISAADDLIIIGKLFSFLENL